MPKDPWLPTLMNRIDPALFEAAFLAWVAALRADGPEVVALDGNGIIELTHEIQYLVRGQHARFDA